MTVGVALASGTACSSSYRDECGNDHAGRQSTVFGVDAATGVTRWQVRVPEDESFVLRDGDSRVRISTIAADHDTVLDTQTGVVLDRPSSSQPGVTFDVATNTATVGDEVQPFVVSAAGLSIQTDFAVTKDDLHLHGDDPAGGEVWQATLAQPGWGGVTRPLVFGGVVVISVKDPHPPNDHFCG